MTAPLDDEARWQAVIGRDKNSDGAFVYGVGSTRIYCRPSCPSRKPQHERVTFFAVPYDAEQEGYRPCQRCRPQEQEGDDPDTRLVLRACREIAREQGDLTEPTHGDPAHGGPVNVAVSLGVSPASLRRAFKKVTGLSFRQYADAHRLGQLKDRLRNGQDVTGALFDVGYGSTSRLYEKAPSQLA